MVLLWRLGLGKWINAWPAVAGRIMVLNHTGRKSGLLRQTPLNYAIIDGEIYCTAGLGETTDWYRNILANPHVEVWTPQGCSSGIASDVSETKERLPHLRQVLVASGLAAKIDGIDAHSMSYSELDRLTNHYRLIRIHPGQLPSAPVGPGDLAWLWTFAALLLLCIHKNRR